MTASASLRQSFLAGLLAILPLFITWKVLSFAFQAVDGVLGPPLNAAVAQMFGSPDLYVHGLGLLSTLLLVLLIGYLTRKVFFKQLLERVELLIDRVPLVRSLYNASRQIVVPFADNAKLPFSQVVLVEYPMPGRYTLGLVAKERVTDDPHDERMVVFFPSNHLHLGYPVLLLRSDVQRIDMTVEEAVKFFVSCGVVGDDRLVRHHGELLAVGHPPRVAP
jgi:uncharacterized membrane protein